MNNIPSENKKTKINYTFVTPSGEEEGTYSTSLKGKPRDAAIKAANKHFGGRNTMNVTIRRLGTNKLFNYVATRKQLNPPKVRVNPDGTRYEVKYITTVDRIWNKK